MRTSKIKIQGLTIPYLIGSDSERYWPMRVAADRKLTQ